MVFMVPKQDIQGKAKKPKPTVYHSSYSLEDLSHPRPSWSVKPSTSSHAPAQKKTRAPSAHAPVAGKSPSPVATKSASPSTTKPSWTASTTPKPTPTRTSVPSVTPSPSPTPTPVPTATQTGPVWITSQTATQAAARMDAAQTVGDPVCSVSGAGSQNVDVPPGVKTVYTGISGNYWCLIYER